MRHDGDRAKQVAIRVLLAIAWGMITVPASAGICMCCQSSPLVLDLAKNGFILTTGISNGVAFDLDADGFVEDVGWTFGAHKNGFLFLDRNGNGSVDDGGELFGNATILPDGTIANNGFEVLRAFNEPDQGGNGDLYLSAEDEIWPSLRLWIDSSHDGITDADEVYTLADWNIVRFFLTIKVTPFIDGVGNRHLLSGSFITEKNFMGATIESAHLIEDIFFIKDTGGLFEIFSDGFETGNLSSWSDLCTGSSMTCDSE